MEEKLDNMEEKLENVDKEPEGTEEKQSIAEEGSESTGEAVADKTVKRSNDEKGKISRKRIAACVELAAAFILISLSAWLFINTRGTRLLYVSVATGRVSRYYWIFIIAAVLFGMIGLVTLKSLRVREQKDA